jgi:hypothetical protein
MASTAPLPTAPPDLLRWFLSLFSLGQVTMLWDLYQIGKQWWPGNTDIYEILDYEASVELLDPSGEKAIFRKRQKVKFLQNNIIAFEDYAWGDGNILAAYKCSPGVVVDKYQEGDRWNILISLRETKSKGDIEEFYIERMEHGTFMQREEWLQTEIRRRTRHLSMSIVFPQERRCQRAIVQQRTHNRVIELGSEHLHSLPDGRQRLYWETNQVRPYEVYTMRWWT